MPNLIPHSRLYGHQERAVRAILARRPTLVSTGTGSGKTEAFLYPIISRCLQLRDEGAEPGIVAVLVYPMNALAEDQLGRLRELLAGTGISFGMYVGKTPERKEDVPGQRLRSGTSVADYLAALEQARREKRGTAVHPPEERPSREEMRSNPPRILLTNVKQLELLLTRQRDVELFTAARLELLVFDEAHTYGGAVGAETACLTRRLRAYCGRTAADTVCVGTSATLADPETGLERARDFASRFFGVKRDQVVLAGEEYEADDWVALRGLPGALPGEPADHLRGILAVVDAEAGDGLHKVFQEMTGASLQVERWKEDLYDHLAQNELCFRIAEVLKRPRPLAEVAKSLSTDVGRPVPEEEVLCWLALGAASLKNGRPFLRPVVHAFVTGVGGGTVTFPREAPCPRLALSVERREPEPGEAELFALPVTTCSTCGQHYFIHHVADLSVGARGLGGGEAVDDRRFWRPLDESHGGVRVVLLDRVVAAEEDEDEPSRTHTAFLCRWCGALHPEAVERCDGCGVEDEPVRLFAVEYGEHHPGHLTACVSCRAPGRATGSRYREPTRPIRAVTVSDVHVLAQNMLRQAERRRLLVFTDNRQDAAFQAGWMHDHARRFRLRALMGERIAQGPVSVGDLVAHLDDFLAADDDLSRALVPEVWQVHRKEAEGIRHAQERKRFLRIQVLREIATGVRQRVGLEPWGRLRVAYAGLEPQVPFISEWAPRLGVSSERLADGIAALLDLQRRRLVLLDRDGQVFSRFWREGDYEVEWGYLPLLKGVPKGLKLERDPSDDAHRVSQWLSARGDTQVRQAARAWGVAAEDVNQFVTGLWRLCTEDLGLLAPVTLLGSRGRVLPRCSGVRQLDADRLRLTPHRGLWRCNKCQRAQVRPLPFDRCLTWRCDGTMAWQEEDPDNYDLAMLDQGFAMLRPAEHSAQVPPRDRERLEHLFKGEGDAVNTLVCTPTLELGVDIGSLDTVLLRNVPPLPANYWQRAGRAGRRHRLAVNITYARAGSHDRAYFADPERMLEGRVEPPRFNLKNELMIAKHVHASLLARLHQLASTGSGLGEHDRTEIGETLRAVFPARVSKYLFDEQRYVRDSPFDVSPLHAVITKHVAELIGHVKATFARNWPAADEEVVVPERLLDVVLGTAGSLETVIKTLRKRLDWCLNQMVRLDGERQRKGTLDADEDALYARCDRLVKRLKGTIRRRRREAEGHDDIDTYGVLAAEGFLPGYGLEVGSIQATAVIPRYLEGKADLDLPRANAVALREYVPGNLIYANGHRFVARYYHLEAVEPTLFQVDVARGAVSESGSGGDRGVSALGADLLPAVPACDVDLAHYSYITDEEEHRFQLAVTVCGYELGRHGSGVRYGWGNRDLLLRRATHLRLVNVGVASLVAHGTLGYPLCLVCGQSRSPFASERERQEFARSHEERCGKPLRPVGFFTDVVADTLMLPECATRDEAYSVLEALRTGMARVLEMERDDLEVLVIGKPGTNEVDALLYDPMPGGSGLLEQACARWGEVVKAALEVSESCLSGCKRSCIDCLWTFRNAFFHRYLDRNLAAESVRDAGDSLVEIHGIPVRLPAAEPREASMPVNRAEQRLKGMLRRGGFPQAEWHRLIDLGRPLGSTRPDCFFPGEGQGDPGVCMYLDGLSQHIHGNPATAQRDRAIREQLRAQHYEVIEIPATDLDDREAMKAYLFRLARLMMGRSEARTLRDDPSWFEELPFRRVAGEPAGRYRTCVPLFTLRAAAGHFSGSQAVEPAEWVEPNTSRKLREGMFVAQVVGKSMEPRIPDGAYCLFSTPVVGSRTGRILLVQHRHIADPDTGGSYTVKVFDSSGVTAEDGGERIGVIRLRPLNEAYPCIELAGAESEGIEVVAEVMDVL